MSPCSPILRPDTTPREKLEGEVEEKEEENEEDDEEEDREEEEEEEGGEYHSRLLFQFISELEQQNTVAASCTIAVALNTDFQLQTCALHAATTLLVLLPKREAMLQRQNHLCSDVNCLPFCRCSRF